ncbi:DNA replication and repair protein RecF [Gammaproteobacteria bacterium]|nr:DNA replication and repair protein RecF [Gammaproteobacteria bacterium]
MISHLEISHLRSINHTSIQLSEGINIFYGDNGSGKSSILEAIYILGRGRSFRTHKIQDIVQTNKKSYLIRAQINQGPMLAVQKGPSDSVAKIGSERSTFSKIAACIPLLMMDSNTHRRFFDEPAFRRRFFDWALFHVEPRYAKSYLAYTRVLKMRNTALKQGGGHEVWDRQLVESGEELVAARFEIVSALSSILPGSESLVYRPSTERSLKESLALSRIHDRSAKVTTVGPHRDDYLFKEGGRLLSQGQQKLAYTKLMCAAKAEISRYKPGVIILLDDICAELSIDARKRVVDMLDRQSDQLLITGVLERDLREIGCGTAFKVDNGEAILIK